MWARARGTQPKPDHPRRDRVAGCPWQSALSCCPGVQSCPQTVVQTEGVCWRAHSSRAGEILLQSSCDGLRDAKAALNNSRLPLFSQRNDFPQLLTRTRERSRVEVTSIKASTSCFNTEPAGGSRIPLTLLPPIRKRVRGSKLKKQQLSFLSFSLSPQHSTRSTERTYKLYSEIN